MYMLRLSQPKEEYLHVRCSDILCSRALLPGDNVEVQSSCQLGSDNIDQETGARIFSICSLGWPLRVQLDDHHHTGGEETTG